MTKTLRNIVIFSKTTDILQQATQTTAHHYIREEPVLKNGTSLLHHQHIKSTVREVGGCDHFPVGTHVTLIHRV